MSHPGLVPCHRARLHVTIAASALALVACGGSNVEDGQQRADDSSSMSSDGGPAGSSTTDAAPPGQSLDGGIESDDGGTRSDTDSGIDAGPDGGGPFCAPNGGELLPIANACTDSACELAACANGAKDNRESGVDCGGPCAPCGAGQRCSWATDCVTGACAQAYCTDDTSYLCDPRQCAQTPLAATQTLRLNVASIARSPLDGTVFAAVSGYQDMVGAVLAFAPGSTAPSYALALPGPSGPLAVTDDGSALYVGIAGDQPGVVRIDAATRVADAPFVLGTSRDGRAVHPIALSTVPGRPDLIGVVGGEAGATGSRIGVHVYKDGVALFDANNRAWQTNTAFNSMTVSAAVFASADRLYAVNGATTAFDFATVDMTPSGLRIASVRNDIVPGFQVQPFLAGGRLFMEGSVVAPKEPRVLGSLRGEGPVTTNRSGTRAYMAAVGDFAPLTIACFDTQTFARSGLVALDYKMPEDASELVIEQLALWGDDGLAITTGQRNLVLVPGALRAPGCGPQDARAPDQALLSAPDARDEWTQTYCLSAADTAYAPRSEILYATVSQQDERFPNRLAAIRVDGTGFDMAPWVGSEPGSLAISEDESTAWLAPMESPALVSVDLSSGAVSTYATALVDPGHALQIEHLTVLPGTTDSVALAGSSGFTSWARVNVYDRGVPRFPSEELSPARDALHAGRVIAADGSRLYAASPSALASLRIGAQGLSVEWELPRAAYPVTYVQGKLLDGAALIVDSAQQQLVGGLEHGYGTPPTLLARNGLHAYRARYAPLSPIGKTRIEVQCFDTRTFTPSGNLVIDVPDPAQCMVGGEIHMGMLGDAGVFLRTDGALVLAPNALACVPGCAPDAEPPMPTLPASPDHQDPTAPVLAYADLQVGDLEGTPSGTLFASVRDTDKRLPNSVLAFDGDTGALSHAMLVGSDPQPLTVSNDGAKLYVGLRKAARIVSVDLASRAVSPWLVLDPERDLGGMLHYPVPVDLQTLPSASDALAIAAAPLNEGSGLGAWKYESGELTSIVPNPSFDAVRSIAALDDHTFWLSGTSVHKATLANGQVSISSGPASSETIRRLTPVGDGNVLTDTGLVFHGRTAEILGQLPVKGATVIRRSTQKILVVARASQGSFPLYCFDSGTLQQTGMTTLAVPVPFEVGYNPPAELELLGREGVALRTDNASLLLYPQALSGVPGC